MESSRIFAFVFICFALLCCGAQAPISHPA
jgi:hypothetical protein